LFARVDPERVSVAFELTIPPPLASAMLLIKRLCLMTSGAAEFRTAPPLAVGEWLPAKVL
jgi:hypothetical protein